MRYLWVHVDLKNAELPLAVADTAKQLAEKCGVSLNTVLSNEWRGRKSNHRSRYVKVPYMEEDENV